MPASWIEPCKVPYSIRVLTFATVGCHNNIWNIYIETSKNSWVHRYRGMIALPYCIIFRTLSSITRSALNTNFLTTCFFACIECVKKNPRRYIIDIMELPGYELLHWSSSNPNWNLEDTCCKSEKILCAQNITRVITWWKRRYVLSTLRAT